MDAMLRANTEQALRPINRIIQRLTTPTSSDTTEIANAIRAGFAQSFENEGSAGRRWQPLAPATVRDRIRKGFPGAHPILVRTGAGRDTFTQAGNADHVEQVNTTGNGWTLVVGSQSEKMGWLIRGTARIPARPVQPFTGDANNNIRAAVAALARRIITEARNG